MDGLRILMAGRHEACILAGHLLTLTGSLAFL